MATLYCFEASQKGGFGEWGRFGKRSYLYPLFGVKVHPPRAFALLEGKIKCGSRTFTPVSVVKAHLLKAPFWKPPFCDTPKKRSRLRFSCVSQVLIEDVAILGLKGRPMRFGRVARQNAACLAATYDLEL